MNAPAVFMTMVAIQDPRAEKVLSCALVPEHELWNEVLCGLSSSTKLVLDTSVLIPVVHSGRDLRFHVTRDPLSGSTRSHYDWVRMLVKTYDVLVPPGVFRELRSDRGLSRKKTLSIDMRSDGVRRELEHRVVSYEGNGRRPFIDERSQRYERAQTLVHSHKAHSLSLVDLEVVAIAAYFALDQQPACILTNDHGIHDTVTAISTYWNIPLSAPNEKVVWRRKNGM